MLPSSDIWLSCSALFELIVVLMSIFVREPIVVWATAIVLSFFGGMNLFLSIVIFSTESRPEEAIEAELRRAWTAPPQPSQSQ